MIDSSLKSIMKKQVRIIGRHVGILYSVRVKCSSS